MQMNHYEFLNRRQRLALAVAAVAAACVGVGAALAPFAVDGSAPYFGNDAASLAAVEHCVALPPRSERHACLRQAAAAASAAAPTRVAQARK
jgi:hypothetical protein